MNAFLYEFLGTRIAFFSIAIYVSLSFWAFYKLLSLLKNKYAKIIIISTDKHLKNDKYLLLVFYTFTISYTINTPYPNFYLVIYFFICMAVTLLTMIIAFTLKRRRKILYMVLLGLAIGYIMLIFLDIGEKEIVYPERIIDGDTLVIMRKESTGDEYDYEEVLYKVRLANIDAPHIKGIFGGVAYGFLKDKCLYEYKGIGLKVDGVDKYNRLLGTIYCDGINVNKALVKNGLARVYKNDTTYKSEEDYAKKHKLGLWSILEK